MYAIAVDLEVAELKRHYGEPYDGAYFEIKSEPEKIGVEWTQGSVYLSKDPKNNLATLYKAIHLLSNIDWFKKSVRDIRAFKVKERSDFTEIVKTSERILSRRIDS